MKQFDPSSRLEQRIKTALDESVGQLDAQTRDQLHSARTHALTSGTKRQHHARFWVPALATACCTLLVASLTLFNSERQISQPEEQTMFELMMQDSDVNTIYDPEFYVWVDEVLQDEGIANAS